MKIGIITSHFCYIRSNYGSLLQNFALQCILKENGMIPLLIKEGEKPSYLTLFKQYLYRLKRRIWRKIGKELPFDILEFNQTHPRCFDVFIEKELNCTANIIDKNKIEHGNINADCYVVGSDQVWTLPDFSKLLCFAPPHKRIAYAASANWGKQTSSWFEVARTSFPLFAGVSVREKEGLDICKKAGCFNVKVVLDPTLLLNKDKYLSLISEKKNIFQSKTILGYFLNIDSLVSIPWNEYLDMCNELNSQSAVIPLQGSERCIPGQYIFTPDPYEFLQAYRDCACVVTNSFHAVVFSIIFEKPFIALEQDGDTAIQNCRIQNLLDLVGLQSRIYRRGKDSMCHLMNDPIDWKTVNEKIKIARQESLAFLLNAVNKAKISN